MKDRKRQGVVAGTLSAAIALALAGCQSGMTYGTGTAPLAQTLQDIAGIAALSGPKREPIDYEPRAKIVGPPAVAAQLPPPSDSSGATAAAANWPNDPDVQAAKMRADIAAREAAGLPLPSFRLPPGARPPTPPATRADDEPMTAAERQRALKMFADARGALAVDETGAPVRRYLSEPPAEYRIPDPNAPVEFVNKPKKRKWFWQR